MEVIAPTSTDVLQAISDKVPYACHVDGCGREYTQKRYLQKHCLEVHKEEQEIQGFRCELNGCTKVLACERYLKNHQKKVHFSLQPLPSPKIMHVCTYEGCARSFSKPSRLRDHEFTHTGERLFKCPHEGCGRSYTRAAHLKRHATSHTDKRPTIFECPNDGCSQKFVSRTNLLKHINALHKKRYKCPEDGCDKRFHKRHQLRRHSLAHDPQISCSQQDFLCKEEGCGKAFKSIAKLKCHVKMHQKGYECEQCGEKFPKWTLLRRHKAVSHAKEYECETCGKVLFRRRQLIEHQQTHDPVNEKKFVCSYDGCGHAYTLKRNLEAHMRSVHQGKKFECTHKGCDRKFSHKVSLQGHMKFHDPNRPLPKPKKKKKVIHKKTLEKVKDYLSRTSSPVFPLPSKAPVAEALDLRLVKVSQGGEVIRPPACTVTSVADYGTSEDEDSNQALDLSMASTKKGSDMIVQRVEEKLSQVMDRTTSDDDGQTLHLVVDDPLPIHLQIEVMSDDECEMEQEQAACEADADLISKTIFQETKVTTNSMDCSKIDTDEALTKSSDDDMTLSTDTHHSMESQQNPVKSNDEIEKSSIEVAEVHCLDQWPEIK